MTNLGNFILHYALILRPCQYKLNLIKHQLSERRNLVESMPQIYEPNQLEFFLIVLQFKAIKLTQMSYWTISPDLHNFF